MKTIRTAMAVLLIAAVAHAEDAKQKQAREELERQLAAMIEKAPSKVRVTFEGFDEPNYDLTEVTLTLDANPIKVPPLTELAQEGTHAVAVLDVPPGSHRLSARVVAHNHTSAIVSDEGGYSWTLVGTNDFDVQSGIEVQVAVVPTRLNGQKELSKRFKLSLPAKPVMIATLDDGKIPDAPIRAPLPPPAPPIPDAGAPAPVDEAKKKADEALAAKKAAADEAKRKADEALAAKKAAADEAKRKADEALAAKKAAADEAKRKADEALAAKRAAAEQAKAKAAEALAAKKAAADEAKAKAAEALAAKKAAAEEAKAKAAEALAAKKAAAIEAAKPKPAEPVAVAAKEPETPKAMEPVAKPVEPTPPGAPAVPVAAVPEVVDAGTPAPIAAMEPPQRPVVVDAGTPAAVAAPVEQESGFPAPVAIGLSLSAIGALIFFMTRKRNTPS